MKLLTISLAVLLVVGLQTADTHAQAGGKWVTLALL